MFLARIEGTVTATIKHPTLAGCRLLVGRRLAADGSAGDEPLVLLDRLGAGRGSTVLVSTDGDLVRKWIGSTAPGRLSVVGIVDRVDGGGGR
jgi:microcompartment protein CcmK/EutM